MSQLIKLFLPLALFAFGLKASQKELSETQKINIDSRVKLYLEGKLALLGKSDLSKKIDKCLKYSQASIISDTVQHACDIAEYIPALKKSIYENSVAKINGENGEIILFGHLSEPSFKVGDILLDDFYVNSKNGRYILTRADDGTARVWDTQWGTSKILIGHNNAVTAIAFSPDSSAVLTGGIDNKVIYWNLESGKIIHCLGNNSPIVKLKFNSNNTFYSVSADNEEKVWAIENGNITIDNSNSSTASKINKSENNTDGIPSVLQLVADISNLANSISDLENLNQANIFDRTIRELRAKKSTLDRQLSNAIAIRCKSDSYIKTMNNIKEETRHNNQAISLEKGLSSFENISFQQAIACLCYERNCQEIRDLEIEISTLTDQQSKNSLLERINLIKKTWRI